MVLQAPALSSMSDGAWPESWKPKQTLPSPGCFHHGVYPSTQEGCRKASNLKNSLSACAGKGEENRLGMERQVRVTA